MHGAHEIRWFHSLQEDTASTEHSAKASHEQKTTCVKLPAPQHVAMVVLFLPVLDSFEEFERGGTTRQS